MLFPKNQRITIRFKNDPFEINNIVDQSNYKSLKKIYMSICSSKRNGRYLNPIIIERGPNSVFSLVNFELLKN